MQNSEIDNIDYSLLQNQNPATVLVVDDDDISLEFLEEQVKKLGHSVINAENGQEALDKLNQYSEHITAVLMDRKMPVMDGITAVRHIKDDPKLRHIPVIMVTSADSEQEIEEGINAGVFYYLTKPLHKDMLISVLDAAVQDYAQSKQLDEELSQQRTSFNLIETCRFKFKTLDEAENLAAFIANCFPDPKRALKGIGALLINAIEHGNLSLGYIEKTRLVNLGTWRAEVERRQKLQQYENKFATVTISRKQNGIYVIIEDQGDGFDWQNYIQIDPSRSADNHGRGIAQASAISFDKITYNEKGNQVVALVGNKRQIDW